MTKTVKEPQVQEPVLDVSEQIVEQQPAMPTLEIGLVNDAYNCIKVAMSRNAFQPDEFMAVGQIYGSLGQYLKKVEEILNPQKAQEGK